MKAAAREHRIVLSDAAIAVLDLVIDRKHEFVFTRAGCRLLSGGLMVKLLKRMNCGDVTTHGFRATFKIWAAAHTAYPRELIEIALSPAEGDALELTYQIEKRRRLMDDWARHCATPEAGGGGALKRK
jgi:integrase